MATFGSTARFVLGASGGAAGLVLLNYSIVESIAQTEARFLKWEASVNEQIKDLQKSVTAYEAQGDGRFKQIETKLELHMKDLHGKINRVSDKFDSFGNNMRFFVEQRQDTRRDVPWFPPTSNSPPVFIADHRSWLSAESVVTAVIGCALVGSILYVGHSFDGSS